MRSTGRKNPNREVTVAADARDRFEIPKEMRFDVGSELRSGARDFGKFTSRAQSAAGSPSARTERDVAGARDVSEVMRQHLRICAGPNDGADRTGE